MKVSYNWLKEWAPFKWTPAEAAEHLTALGFPVERMESTGVSVKNVVAVKILSVEKHPNADRLRLATVTDGKTEKVIVCGAPNIAVGQVVPLAQPGAELPGGVKITVSSIRGVESAGMLCSERELGLSEEHAGIYMLPENTKLGTDINTALGGSDTIFEIDVTPNRADALSHIGLARELAAAAGIPLKKLSFTPPASKKSVPCRIRIQEPKLCSRYIGRVINNVKIGPSPDWMARRLKACGIRSINNIVDITNYVLLEWGHPLHAFDLAKLAGPEINVRRAQGGEKITALDGKVYALSNGHLVIADAEKPVAIAGIMGGEGTGVTNATTDILLESAVFDRAAIRIASKQLNLKSESSIRFDKGTNAETAAQASLRALQLILELAGGTVGAFEDAYPKKDAPAKVSLSLTRLEELTGGSFKPAEVSGLFKRLDFQPAFKTGAWTIKVPAYRRDIAEDVDLVEEVVRHTGYDAIPPRNAAAALGQITPALTAPDTDAVSECLRGLGFNEAISSSFSAAGIAARFVENESQLVPIANPLSMEESVLRPTLTVNLLNALLRNANLQRDSTLLFEVGHVFAGEKEPLHVALAAFGDAVPKTWNQSGTPADFHFLKGAVDALVHAYARNVSYEFGAGPAFLHPKQNFLIRINNQPAGWGGAVHPMLANELGLKSGAVAAEIDLRALFGDGQHAASFTAPSKFPWVERDIAVVVDKGLAWAEIEKRAKEAAQELRLIRPFDVFEGAAVGDGRKSVAFRLRLQHAERTLTDAEINDTVERIKTALKNHCGAQLR